MSKAIKELYQNLEYKEKHDQAVRIAIKTEEWKRNHKLAVSTKENRLGCKERAKRLWEDPDFVKVQSQSTKKRWKDDSYRKKVMDKRNSEEGRAKARIARLKVWAEKRDSMMLGQKKRLVLSDDQVSKIRLDKRPIRKIASEYGVAFDTIRKCRLGITYKHVPMVLARHDGLI